MALRECPHCGNPVSDTAETCPTCGHEFPENRGRYAGSSSEDTQFYGLGGNDDNTQLVDDSQDTQYFDPNQGFNYGQRQQDNDPGYNPYWNNQNSDPEPPQPKYKKYTLAWIILGAAILAFGGIILSDLLVKKIAPGVTPEEQVRQYGKYMKDKVALDQLDSLLATYPDITKADSIVSLDSDTILVTEISKDKIYDMTLADGVKVRVNLDKNRNLSVEGSYGLFAFPANKLKTAKETGLWNENINDVELDERMNDQEFFNWLKDEVKRKTTNIISLGSSSGGVRYIHNNSDQPINASDYTVSAKEYYSYQYWDDWWWEYRWKTGTRKKTLSGKAIPPHGSVAYDQYNRDITGVSMKISQDELQRRFAPYQGDEYKRYKSQKD